MGPGATAQQTQMDSDYSAPTYGPNFETQVARERSIEDINKKDESSTSNEFLSKYMSANRQAQSGRSDGSSIANKYIKQANDTNPIDVVALDKHIRRGPMYHEAKSELAGLLTYGDKYRNSRENPLEWSQPDPMKGVEKPDFEGIYDKTKKDVDDIKI